MACLKLAVQVIPNARKTEVAGMAEGVLRIRLKAQPIEGAANAELIKWLAKQLGCPKSSLRIVQGETSRRKLIELQLPAHMQNMDVQQLQALLLGACS